MSFEYIREIPSPEEIRDLIPLSSNLKKIKEMRDEEIKKVLLEGGELNRYENAALKDARRKLRSLLWAAEQPMSLEMSVGDDGENELGDFIEDEGVEDFSLRADQGMLEEVVERALLVLKAKEAQVLRLRFGLDDGKDRTLEQVGEVMGVTRERIRQIERKALNKLRHPHWAERLRPYL